MAHARENFIWLMVLVVGFGSLAVVNLGRGVPHLLKGDIGIGMTVALILGATATLLALSALSQWLAVLASLIRRGRNSQHKDRPRSI